jgi:hypothetical protein
MNCCYMELSLSPQKQQQENGTIMHIAKNNGCPRNLMSQLKKTTKNYRIHTASPEPTSLQMRATCNYHSSYVRQITNLFQRGNWRIGFRSWNTIYKLLKHQKEINSKCVLARVATRSKPRLQLLACWDCGFESCQRHGCLSVVIIMCCQGEVSVMSWSLTQRISADCRISVFCWWLMNI